MKQEAIPFTSYQKFIIAVLAVLQFTIILDFMIMSPLGDLLMKSMNITPVKFGVAVSAYAFSAGIAGFIAAGFADKFDRKKLLLFFYVGFVVGTLFCGLANNYPMLLAARIITGLFGGVVGSIGMAIITDIFLLSQRGRVMGFVQMAFAASQVLGIPIGIVIANQWGWNAPFIMIVLFAVLIGVVVFIRMKPVVDHLALQSGENAFAHLLHTISQKNYRIGFGATAMLSIGGFMLMPFASAFSINNLKVTQDQLPYVFMFTGLASILIMPVIGKLSDKIDKVKIFLFGSFWAMIIVLLYTNLGEVPLWFVIVVNILMFMGIMSRMVPVTAMVSAVPEMKDRGAFMSINSSLQQIAGGISSFVAGMIVVQKTKISPLEHYNWLGIVVVIMMFACIYFVFKMNYLLKNKQKK